MSKILSQKKINGGHRFFSSQNNRQHFKLLEQQICGFKLLYFVVQVQGLSDELAKQLWMVLQRSMVTVRRDPTMLVSVVRIIEREEKIDRRMVDRKKQTGFIPPGRPKRWKDKMFDVRRMTKALRNTLLAGVSSHLSQTFSAVSAAAAAAAAARCWKPQSAPASRAPSQ